MEFEVTIPAGEFEGERYDAETYKVRVFEHTDVPKDGRGMFAPFKAEATKAGGLYVLHTYGFTAEAAATSIRRMLLGSAA